MGKQCQTLIFGLKNHCIMRNAGLEEALAGIKIAGRNSNNLRYADDNINNLRYAGDTTLIPSR